MASLLTTRQAQLAALEAQREALLADPATTDEQITTLTASLTTARAGVAAAQALVNDQLAALAASTTRLQDTGSLSATPRAEKDPRRGFSSVGQFAIDIKAMQDAHRKSMQLDPQTAARLAIVQNDTRQFAAAEAAEVARLQAMGYQVAAPTPLHQEGNSTDGLMVPIDFRQQIWTPAYEADDLLALFNPQSTSSRVVQFAADETTPWGSQGVHAYWTAEGAQKQASKLALSPREVHIHKIAALVFTTDELLQDTALLTSRINEAAPRAIGWEVSEAIIRGNGSGKPLGYEAAGYAGLVVITKETNQKAGTIYTENVLKMAARINEGPGSRLIWLAHRSTIPSIATLKIGNEPSWTNQNQGLREAPSGMLLGSPVKFTQHAKFLGTQGDLSYIDAAGYAAFVHSSGTKFDASIHLYFDYDITAFRWVMRVGGMPYASAPVTQANGNDSMSQFVELATRA